MKRVSFKHVVLAMPLALLFASAFGCGGGSGSSGDGGQMASGTSGVAGSKTIANLTDADRKKICDWTAALYGGYGRTITCSPTLEITGPADLAECLAEAATVPATCAATVAQAEGCTRTIASCSDAVSADCTALFACLQ